MASYGLAPVLPAGGVVYFLTTNLTGLRPEWREVDRLRGQAPHRAHPAATTPRGAVCRSGPRHVRPVRVRATCCDTCGISTLV